MRYMMMGRVGEKERVDGFKFGVVCLFEGGRVG